MVTASSVAPIMAKVLVIGQRVEQLAFLAGQREHRDEGQDDDQHGEEDGPADLRGGRQRLGQDLGGREPRGRSAVLGAARSAGSRFRS